MNIVQIVGSALMLIVLLSVMLFVPWRIVVKNAQLPKKTEKMLKYTGIVMVLLMFPAMGLGHGKHIDPLRLYGDSMFGIIWVAFVWSSIVGFLGLIIQAIIKKKSPKIVSAVALITIISMLSYGFYGANKQPDMNYETIKLTKLNPKLNGTKVALISDAHFGPINQEKWMAKIVQRINAENPDVVIFAGDIADGTAEQRRAEADELKNIKASTRVYVTGNHEYIEGVIPWENEIKSFGWNVLINENVEVNKNGSKFTIAGVDDASAVHYDIPGQAPNFDKAMAGVDKDNPVIMVAHQPKQVEGSKVHKVDLQVSGHTHGGQIWPFEYLIPLDQPVVEGLEQMSDTTQLFVTRGIGSWGPPLRIFAPSEINILELSNQG
ncbi:MAG: metallophosphoesterase [Micrococcaceae bacterium]